jgi:hypothetical protein
MNNEKSRMINSLSMKKINIQRDVESRRNMAQAFSPVKGFETEVEPIKQENDAESEKKDGQADNAGAPTGKKPEKGRRTTQGNV